MRTFQRVLEQDRGNHDAVYRRHLVLSVSTSPLRFSHHFHPTSTTEIRTNPTLTHHITKYVQFFCVHASQHRVQDSACSRYPLDNLHRARRSHGGYAGVRLGEAQNPGPTEHERDLAEEEPSVCRTRALTRRETQYKGARTPSREEFGSCE